MLVFSIVLAVLAYFIFMLFHHFQGRKAAIAAFIFLIFFNIYGSAYKYLLHLDVIRIKHYTFLPLMLMVIVYLILFIKKLEDSILENIWNSLVWVFSALIIFYLVGIVPAEIQKRQSNVGTTISNTQELSTPTKKLPDIYYIIFDEFEGLQGMREYWHYEGVDDFASFLKERGFFVAEESHGSSIDTLHEMATRLNYQEYPLGEEYIQTYFDDIAENRAIQYLKSRGYTIVVFDETNMGYPSAKPIRADYSYEYGSSSIPETEVGSYAFHVDEFGELVLDNTMLYAISLKYKSSNAIVSQHSSMISFTVNHIASKDVPSPKFVHVHLLLPHAPYIFDPNGNIVDSAHFTNWNYYIDTYQYSIKVAETMVNNIFSNSDPENPPIIVLQSDHGARNHKARNGETVILENYPEELKTLILFALYIPGYDDSALPQDIKPINTFPIVFNSIFDAGIPLIK